jgi:hypothetical protein
MYSHVSDVKVPGLTMLSGVVHPGTSGAAWRSSGNRSPRPKSAWVAIHLLTLQKNREAFVTSRVKHDPKDARYHMPNVP